ncbi:hypothetical protein CJI97_001420 [Candidozyma auris]|nr:hypothetical_protein [[Candida] auris]KND98946.1 hypothetical protein QG37_04292 [[Candida] auris]PIS56174.1 hypothetical protein CJI97_001420 [[Candida] auris]PIS56648.1 hypothetical protein B9J08_001186 [[Candida] auris]QEO22173.1 hypothetical_protein [[Candida] auris]QRG38953.1 hypothetical protein FDK38_003373 [[Candida] auris]
MRVFNLAVALSAISAVQAVAIKTVDAQITEAPALEKRAKDAIINKEYQKMESLKLHGSTSDEAPKPWVRTIYSTVVEIVTPTVVGGVTFSGEPPAETNGLEPWISLDKNGSPKTIKPKIKGGVTKNASPTYGTYFQTPVTKTYNKEELKAHNMKEDQIFEHVVWEKEDTTYHDLNPVIRCTPKLYKNKGMAKNISPEPFCFPRDDAVWKMDKTYFVTWYHRFFDEDVSKVKLHLSYVKEAARQKGMKRSLTEYVEDSMEKVKRTFGKRSQIMEKGGKISQKSFFTSDWIDKETGIYPVTIDPKWLDTQWTRRALISLQPDTIPDDEFDHLKNSIVVELTKGAKVGKGHNLDLKKQEEKARLKALYGDYYEIEEGIDYEKYIIMMTIPTCVLIAVMGMYFFIWINRKHTDLAFLKNVKFKKKTRRSRLPFSKKNENKYTELPQWEGPKAD